MKRDGVKTGMGRQGPDDLRWIRIGWFDQGRHCDDMVKHAVQEIPGGKMPQRWRAKDLQDFCAKYGEGVNWSLTASYVQLFLGGRPILRIYTNAKTKTQVELSAMLSQRVKDLLDIEDIPDGTKFCSPFAYRTNVTQVEELAYILQTVKVMYGLENQ